MHFEWLQDVTAGSEIFLVPHRPREYQIIFVTFRLFSLCCIEQARFFNTFHHFGYDIVWKINLLEGFVDVINMSGYELPCLFILIIDRLNLFERYIFVVVREVYVVNSIMSKKFLCSKLWNILC